MRWSMNNAACGESMALRVIDLSVFPVQISGNPHGPAMMMGDRVSDMILAGRCWRPDRQYRNVVLFAIAKSRPCVVAALTIKVIYPYLRCK